MFRRGKHPGARAEIELADQRQVAERVLQAGFDGAQERLDPGGEHRGVEVGAREDAFQARWRDDGDVAGILEVEADHQVADAGAENRQGQVRAEQAVDPAELEVARREVSEQDLIARGGATIVMLTAAGPVPALLHSVIVPGPPRHRWRRCWR